MILEGLTTREINELNIEYLPRHTVPDMQRYFDEAARRSAAARERLSGHYDLAYGDTALQSVDIFPATNPGAPVFVFIHGGYWRAQDKSTYSEIAEPFVNAGATVVLPNYDLCPAVTITDIVQQMREALAWIYANITQFNGNPEKHYLSGHSAGGHLTGMMMATDWPAMGLPKDLLKGASPLSGLFDIEPHRHTELQGDIRLTAEEAAANSPQFLPLTATCPVLCAVGGGESGSFHRQSREFAEKCRAAGLPCEYLELNTDNHFDITDRLHKPEDPLTRAQLKLMGL
ncbi:alpha/beta hydrolase [Sneathiella litorea]|uniref:Alpha/beta hydrolase fold domain-containing protein n=1 Tax=Sneathiella litorea TaxID=2606216 RepID=A0A6L8WDG4_9PROT|nr:alpha/beta hydrolase [Sneathiella litorea]MZR32197.1 alpha/beta hydrolase fold domain-containing protein [Sneathiella litorea]